MEKRTNHVLILSRATSNPHVKAKLQNRQLRNFPLTINHCRNVAILQRSRCVMCLKNFQLFNRSSSQKMEKVFEVNKCELSNCAARTKAKGPANCGSKKST